MRVLHVVKTSNGAVWAADQAKELVARGVDVHVALPNSRGSAVDQWIRSGAIIHVQDLSFPASTPWRLKAVSARVREFVEEVRPDVIHSHFVSTTLSLRLALGKEHPVPRIFQVPGPLHLEHPLFRYLDLFSAARNDYWIASSLYTRRLYEHAGVSPDRLFLSYYGTDVFRFHGIRKGVARHALNISDRQLVVGNINVIYPPRYGLGQFKGLKLHELVIDALAQVIARRSDVTGVLFGGMAGGPGAYELRLRSRAARKGAGRIRMPGFLDPAQVPDVWPDFDCAVHVPLSENCGGVGEPLLSGVPTIAGNVGGLPEVVVDGITGRLVQSADPKALAEAILSVLEELPHHKRLARTGRALHQVMFDPRRTAAEVLDIYRHIVDPALPRPSEFDSISYAKHLAARTAEPVCAN